MCVYVSGMGNDNGKFILDFSFPRNIFRIKMKNKKKWKMNSTINHNILV